MLKNNIKIAIRTILKQRMYAVLNVLGLGVGMASCLLISFYVSEETSYDKFYKDAENVYRVTTYLKFDGDEEHFATTPPPLGSMVLQQIPEVQSMVRLFKGGDMTMRADHDFDNPFRETNAWSVDQGFFEVFDYGFIEGDYEKLFTEPKTLVMPKSTAIRYFGQEAFDQSNIVGRFLGGGGDGGTPWKVVGIMEDQPKTSHFQFDMLLSTVDESRRKVQIWGWNSFHTYVRLGDSNPSTIAAVEKGLEKIIINHALPSSNTPSGLALNDDLAWEYQLQPIADIHLTPSLIREMRPKGNQLYVNSLIVVALFIIILACVNFINLSTAKSSIRAKEIGVKKILGSGRLNLIYQFLVESLLFSYLALILAFGISELMVVILENYFQWQLDTSLLNNLSSWLIIIGRCRVSHNRVCPGVDGRPFGLFCPGLLFRGFTSSGRSGLAGQRRVGSGPVGVDDGGVRPGRSRCGGSSLSRASYSPPPRETAPSAASRSPCDPAHSRARSAMTFRAAASEPVTSSLTASELDAEIPIALRRFIVPNRRKIKTRSG